MRSPLAQQTVGLATFDQYHNRNLQYQSILNTFIPTRHHTPLFESSTCAEKQQSNTTSMLLDRISVHPGKVLKGPSPHAGCPVGMSLTQARGKTTWSRHTAAVAALGSNETCSSSRRGVNRYRNWCPHQLNQLLKAATLRGPFSVNTKWRAVGMKVQPLSGLMSW